MRCRVATRKKVAETSGNTFKTWFGTIVPQPVPVMRCCFTSRELKFQRALACRFRSRTHKEPSDYLLGKSTSFQFNMAQRSLPRLDDISAPMVFGSTKRRGDGVVA